MVQKINPTLSLKIKMLVWRIFSAAHLLGILNVILTTVKGKIHRTCRMASHITLIMNLCSESRGRYKFILLTVNLFDNKRTIFCLSARSWEEIFLVRSPLHTCFFIIARFGLSLKASQRCGALPRLKRRPYRCVIIQAAQIHR